MSRHPSLIPYSLLGEEAGAKRHLLIELRGAQRGDKSLCWGNSWLYGMVRERKPETVVETGVHWGVSTAFILQALADNGKGRLYSIDLPNVNLDWLNNQKLGRKTTGFLVPESLRCNWSLILGDATVELPKLLERLSSIDMFHHDSRHTYEHMMFEFETAFPRLRKGGIIGGDDLNTNSSFVEFCSAHSLKPVFLGKNRGYAII